MELKDLWLTNFKLNTDFSFKYLNMYKKFQSKIITKLNELPKLYLHRSKLIENIVYRFFEYFFVNIK